MAQSHPDRFNPITVGKGPLEDIMRFPSQLFAMLMVSSISVAYAQTPATSASSPGPSPGGKMMGSDWQGMQSAMQKMQEHMTKVNSATDSAERQKLMLDHMSTMRDAMGTMMKMGGGPGTEMMSGTGMMHRGMTRGPPAAPASGGVPGRMQMMEQRMEMMQMMMDQMMQHQDMMERRQ